ncbi:RWD domain-containing protein 2B [Xenentodon cancila]
MSYLEWAECQLAEIELLSSMFPSAEELELPEQLAVAELRSFVEAAAPADGPPPCRPHFLLKHKLPTPGMETEVVLSCSYPSEYPSVLPDVTVRCSSLSRAQQTELQAHLNKHLMENCLGEVCVLAAVDWVKDSLQLFINKSLIDAAAPRKEPTSARAQHVFSRLWIYSHHIYNKSKRKNILEWSKELGLSGFSMPGKPGIVCVEGPQSACEEFWSRVKVLTWKKIMIRHREDVALDHEGEDKTGESIDSLRKFTGFEEAMFDPHGNRGNHMDLGQLYQFLNQKGCCDVFQIYFGIEGRSSDLQSK